MPRVSIAIAAIVTVLSIVLWQATGGDYYTKYEVVEQVDAELDDNDPLAAAGFYDDASRTETVVRREFRLGLLPTPQGLLDKHALSVVTITGLSWVLALGLAWIMRLRVRWQAL